MAIFTEILAPGQPRYQNTTVHCFVLYILRVSHALRFLAINQMMVLVGLLLKKEKCTIKKNFPDKLELKLCMQSIQNILLLSPPQLHLQACKLPGFENIRVRETRQFNHQRRPLKLSSLFSKRLGPTNSLVAAVYIVISIMRANVQSRKNISCVL